MLHTVHTDPSVEVFLRSMRKWGGSFVEFYFINVHIIGDPGSKTVLEFRVFPPRDVKDLNDFYHTGRILFYNI